MPIPLNSSSVSIAGRRPQRDLSHIFVDGEGPEPSPLMFVGLRPGLHEAIQQRVFVGESGMELTRYMRLAGVYRDSAFVTNIVRNYTGPDEDTTPEEIERDLPALRAEIERVNPSVIVALGGVATRILLGMDVDMYAVNGLPFAGGPLCPAGSAVFPILHPAAGLHEPDAIGWIHEGFEALGGYLAGEDFTDRIDTVARPSYRWEQQPTVWSERVRGVIDTGMDTEGSRKYPYTIQLSSIGGRADVIRAADLKRFPARWRQFGPRVRWIMHNAVHDILVAEAMGLEIPDGSYDDTMVMSYLLHTMPRGLKPLAFRLCGMEMHDYEEITRPVQQAQMLAYLRNLAAIPWPKSAEVLAMERDKRGNFTPRVKKPWSVARKVKRILDDYAAKGDEAVDLTARWTKALEEHADAGLVRDYCGLAPVATLADVAPDLARDYAGRDADATLRVKRKLWPRIQAMGLETCYEIDMAVLPMVAHMTKTGIPVDCAKLAAMGAKMERKCAEIQAEIRRVSGHDINPNSGDQVADLLYNKLQLHRRARKDGVRLKLTASKTRISTKDDVLGAVKAYHPVVPLIQSYREHEKLRSTYCYPLIEIAKASGDGRIHPNIRYTSVVSGRFACADPNLLAIPAHGDLAAELRDCFYAPPGYVFASWDLSQIEMRVMAHESGDEGLIGAYRRGEDIHANTGARMFGMTVAEVMASPRNKNLYRYPAKQVGFGVLMLITGMGVAAQMMKFDAKHADGSPWLEHECDDLIEMWFAQYPKVKQYQLGVRGELLRTGMVREALGGRIRKLQGIYSYVERVSMEAWRQGCAFKISSFAQAFMKKGMAQVWRELKQVWWPAGLMIHPILQVHDELLMLIPEGSYDEIDGRVKELLCGHTQLSLPTSAGSAQGETWGKVEK